MKVKENDKQIKQGKEKKRKLRIENKKRQKKEIC